MTALSFAKPACDYFQLNFYNDLKPLYFYSARVCERKPTSSDIEDLKVFLFFTQLFGDNLKAEVPMYLSQAVGVPTEVLKVQWWQKHKVELTRWSRVGKQVILEQPSSAAAVGYSTIFSMKDSCSLENC